MTDEVFNIFLKRIERGELDGGVDLDHLTRKFATELSVLVDDELLTAREVSKLWLHYLKRQGYLTEIPE